MKVRGVLSDDSPGFLMRRAELFLRGDLRKLDLKLSRAGSLTIHDGGTVMSLLTPVNIHQRKSFVSLLHFQLTTIGYNSK